MKIIVIVSRAWNLLTFGLVLFLPPALGWEEAVSSQFPWMIDLHCISRGLSIADNLLVITGSKFCIRKTCYEVDLHFLKPNWKYYVGIDVVPRSSFWNGDVVLQPGWMEPGGLWSLLEVMESEAKANKSIFNCNKTVVNKPLSFLLNFFHYLPIEILENDCSPIPEQTKSISILKCTVRTWQTG